MICKVDKNVEMTSIDRRTKINVEGCGRQEKSKTKSYTDRKKLVEMKENTLDYES